MKDMKDKRIILVGLAYVAEVYWTDGTMSSAGHHATLVAAQRALAKYPEDVFEGYDNPCGKQSLQHMANVYESNKRKEDERKENERVLHLKPRRKINHKYERLYDRRVM